MTENKSNRNDRSELTRFDLSSIFDTVPTDQDVSVTTVKIIELKRGRTALQKLQRAVDEGTAAQLTSMAA